jgi:hypothetical protein
LRWIVPADTPDGDYRISHFGYYKNIDASIVPYNGTTESFKVNKLNLLYRKDVAPRCLVDIPNNRIFFGFI